MVNFPKKQAQRKDETTSSLHSVSVLFVFLQRCAAQKYTYFKN